MIIPDFICHNCTSSCISGALPYDARSLRCCEMLVLCSVQEEGVSSSVIACGTAQEDGLCLGVDIAQDSCDHR